ncbi:MAG: F-type H+-transporting ATPase subunit b [Candidatus Tokpelaia sp. JSC085]|nr:MAG: F-type H+-transporting ATPase subunit b [Candidatus Tokpelaia sp. JSC085]
MNDTSWTLIALLLFMFLLIIIRVPVWIKHCLDDRARCIANELEEARRLREEAHLLLDNSQCRRFDAEREAEHIISAALHEARMITTDAHKKTMEYIERRNRVVDQKIARAEADIHDLILAATIDLAAGAVEKIISGEMTQSISDDFLKKSLHEVKTNLNCL